jgi:hypothetical protein
MNTLHGLALFATLLPAAWLAYQILGAVKALEVCVYGADKKSGDG